MAGQYTPKRGPYAGQTFGSYRQYLNQKAQDEGYANFSQKSTIKRVEKETEEIRDEIDVQFQETKEFKGNTFFDIYRSDFIGEMLSFILTLPDSQSAKLIVETERAIGSSKSMRKVRGYSTLINKTRVSLLKREIQSGIISKDIQSKLIDAGSIYNVVLWVYRK